MLTVIFAVHGAAAYNFVAVPPHGGCARRRNAPPVNFEQTEEIDPGEVAGLRVLKYPHPLLRAENSDVEKFDYDLKQVLCSGQACAAILPAAAVPAADVAVFDS